MIDLLKKLLAKLQEQATLLQAKLAAMKVSTGSLEAENASVTPITTATTPIMTNQQKIYQTAKSLLGKHLTLDTSVSPDLGCAEAVSYVLKEAGITNLPQYGFPGTPALYDWLRANFDLVTDPEQGDVIIDVSGTSSIGTPHGHTGIVLMYGVGSNDSNTGLFRENYTLQTWNDLFHVQLKFPTYCFRARG